MSINDIINFVREKYHVSSNDIMKASIQIKNFADEQFPDIKNIELDKNENGLFLFIEV